METETRNIISFYELSEGWQKEAKHNLDESAEETMYLEPTIEYDPNKVLWDLSDCMRQAGSINGFEYNAVIDISNNSAMVLAIDDNGETAEIMFC